MNYKKFLNLIVCAELTGNMPSRSRSIYSWICLIDLLNKIDTIPAWDSSFHCFAINAESNTAIGDTNVGGKDGFSSGGVTHKDICFSRFNSLQRIKFCDQQVCVSM